MTTRQKRIDSLVDYVAHSCASAGIKFILKDAATVGDKHTVGFFSADSKELVVATKVDKFYQVLAHEAAHLAQWQEGLFDCEDAYESFTDWIRGERSLDASTVISNVRLVAECELDAEKRCVKLLTQFGLLGPIEKKDYIKKANSYVLTHEIARTKRAWTKIGYSPAETKEIWNLLPSKFIKDVGRVPDDFYGAVLDFCY